MARRPPDWRQPSLFPPDPGDAPEPKDDATQQTNGDSHALQDDHLRTPATTPTDARAAAEVPQAADSAGELRQGTEGEPPGLDAPAHPDEAGQQPEPDLFRGAGNSRQGTGGSFARRITAEREQNAFPRRGHAVSQSSHAARVRASRREPTLFDRLPSTPATSDPEPPPAQQTPTPFTTTPPPAQADTFPTPATPSVRASPGEAIASGEKAKARDILAAIRTLKAIEQEQREATPEEKQTLSRFA